MSWGGLIGGTKVGKTILLEHYTFHWSGRLELGFARKAITTASEPLKNSFWGNQEIEEAKAKFIEELKK